MKRTGANMPDHWLFLPIEPANVLVATCFGFGDSRADRGLESAPTMLDTGLSRGQGRPERILVQRSTCSGVAGLHARLRPCFDVCAEVLGIGGWLGFNATPVQIGRA